jgi:hypothetical protein
MDKPVPIEFPLYGLTVARGRSAQPPRTTPRGINVRAFDPFLDRARGGSRPGLSRLVPAQVPGGSFLIQHLQTVILMDYDALPVLDDQPVPPYVLNPSNPGPPDSWGIDPGGHPTGTRSPQPNFPPGGTGYQPNKNQCVDYHITVYGPSGLACVGDTVTWTHGTPFFSGFLPPWYMITDAPSSAGDGAGAPAGSYAVDPGYSISKTPGFGNTCDKVIVDRVIPGTLIKQNCPPPDPPHCFQGQITIAITVPPPDVYHWNGQTATFNGSGCATHEPGTALGVFTDGTGVGLGPSVTLSAYITAWLSTQPTSLSSVHSQGGVGTVTSDRMGTASMSACSGSPCSDAPPPDHDASPGGIGTVL